MCFIAFDTSPHPINFWSEFAFAYLLFTTQTHITIETYLQYVASKSLNFACCLFFLLLECASTLASSPAYFIISQLADAEDKQRQHVKAAADHAKVVFVLSLIFCGAQYLLNN